MNSASLRSPRRGFTLIELLIVVAIIAILAAIAVPNFLEAQVRSRVSRAKADMRSVITAMAAYRVDTNKPATPTNVYTSDDFDPTWWGFCSTLLTTPVAYITSMPIDAFPDLANGSLRSAWPGNNFSIPYAVVIRTNSVHDPNFRDFMWLGSSGVSTWPFLDSNTRGQMQRAASVFISAGPDTKMTWQYAQLNNPNFPATAYDPTNGTTSNGDIFSYE